MGEDASVRYRNVTTAHHKNPWKEEVIVNITIASNTIAVRELRAVEGTVAHERGIDLPPRHIGINKIDVINS